LEQDAGDDSAVETDEENSEQWSDECEDLEEQRSEAIGGNISDSADPLSTTISNTLSNLDISDSSTRELSRSPPKLRESLPIPQISTVKEVVSSDRAKSRARQERKYHSKKSSRRAGRPQGSKAKQDIRVKPDSTGFWG
jgi:RIO kinase 2